MSSESVKTAYPYITLFKKEPFKSFLLIKSENIKPFFFKDIEKVKITFRKYEEYLMNKPNKNLEDFYWYLLLKKYLHEQDTSNNEKILNFITDCEVKLREKDQIGFKESPDSNNLPNIWSTYHALSCLVLLGELNNYLSTKGHQEFFQKIKNFIQEHKKNGRYLHCLDKNCGITSRGEDLETLYYVLEILTILGVDVRILKKENNQLISDKRKEYPLAFKLLCLKYLDLENEVRDKDLQALLQNQTRDGGFNFKNQEGDIDATFWIVYLLENYSWLIDYNPVGIYSFINFNLMELLKDFLSNLTSEKFEELVKLIISLCFIWNRLIDHLEKLIFKQLEEKNYINVDLIVKTFGLKYGIDEISSYIGNFYNFKLEIVDNVKNFYRFINNLNEAQSTFFQEFYDILHQKSIVSLSDLYKKYRIKYSKEDLKFKEKILPLIEKMCTLNFFKGNIRIKRGLSFKTKYYFHLDFLLDKIIISNMDLDLEKILEEKARIREIKNDIYNMILKLRTAPRKIFEEIESYLLIDEIDYAKHRLKFLLRDTLMEADFLNENIENSFNENLIFVNFNNALKHEINAWKEIYSSFQQKLAEIEKVLQQKINEKEEIKNYLLLLDELENKIKDIEEYFNKELNKFRNQFNEVLEERYESEKLKQLIDFFNNISTKLETYDQIIYNISQKIILKNEQIIEKHKVVINNWIKIKKNLINEFNFYDAGFKFFNQILEKIKSIKEEVENEFSQIENKAEFKIKESRYQEAFDLIKKLSESLISRVKDKILEIKNLTSSKIKKEQKIYALLKHLQKEVENLNENIIELIASKVSSLKREVIEVRNRSQLENFDRLVSNNIIELNGILKNLEDSLNNLKAKNIGEINKEFDKAIELINNYQKKYIKKLNELRSLIPDFDEDSITCIQWEQYREKFSNEIENLREKAINKTIFNTIFYLSEEGKSDKIDIKKLSDHLNIKCKELIPKIKNLMEISKIQGEFYEDQKELLLHTEHYYKIKELDNYLEKRLIKNIQENMGKLIALYDSCLKNGSLGANLTEIQNRINELSNFDNKILNDFKVKVLELRINQERKEFTEIKERLNELIATYRSSINEIAENLKFFIEIRNFILEEHEQLKLELDKYFIKVFDLIESNRSINQIIELFNNKQQKFETRMKTVQEKIEAKMASIVNSSPKIKAYEPEIREFYVRTKKELNKLYEKKIKKIIDTIEVIKFEQYQNELLNRINKEKIYLSQLLGSLQARVEDYIETEQFKRAIFKIRKRQKDIDNRIKEASKNIKTLLKEFNKSSKGFEIKNKNLIDDFELFLTEFSDILLEKIKSAEEQIVKAYVEMAIKAVAKKVLTLNFLQNELGIKKQKIQLYLLSLISSEQLKGMYDPQLGIYYEDPEILKELDEKELEVMNKMNYRMHRILRRLKIFSSQYGSIIGFFASLFGISYYIFMISGQNPGIIIGAIIIIFAILTYFLFKKRKEEQLVEE